MVGRSPLGWACGQSVEFTQRLNEYVQNCLQVSAFRVQTSDPVRPPFRCDSRGEVSLVNVGLKRRGREYDTFRCFRCGTW